MKLLSMTTIVVMLLAFSCQDSGYETHPGRFNKSVGGRINSDAGLRWIQSYHELVPGREESFGVSQAVLDKVMDQQNVMGIAFHFGFDDQKNLHILMTAIHEDLTVWTGIIIDTNNGNEVSYNVARQWVGNYKNANQAKVIRHSYGIDMFADIRRYNRFEIKMGLDDKGRRVLVLQAQDPNASDTKAVMWDGGVHCPPYC